METILGYILIGIIGFIIGRKTAKNFAPKSGDEMNEMRKEAREAVAERTEERKRNILEMLRQSKDKFAEGCNIREGENKNGITRNDIEKLLDVSDTTAGKYLNELEEAGKIKQIGTSGKDVHYILAK